VFLIDADATDGQFLGHLSVARAQALVAAPARETVALQRRLAPLRLGTARSLEEHKPRRRRRRAANAEYRFSDGPGGRTAAGRAAAAYCRRGRERKGRRGLCSREKTTGRGGKELNRYVV
jgi:hypothetical protein